MVQALKESGNQRMAQELTRAIVEKQGRQVSGSLESSIKKAFEDGANITGGTINTKALRVARDLAVRDSERL